MNINIQKSMLIEQINATEDTELLISIQQMLDSNLQKQASLPIPKYVQDEILSRATEAEKNPSSLIAEEDMNKYLESL